MSQLVCALCGSGNLAKQGNALVCQSCGAECSPETAQRFYERILAQDASDWQANFYAVYYRSRRCKITQIQNTAADLRSCGETVLKLVQEHVSQPAEQKRAVDEIAAGLIDISDMLYKAATNHYNGINPQIRDRYTTEYLDNCCAVRDVMYGMGDSVLRLFGEGYGKQIAVPCWKVGIEQHRKLVPHFAKKKAHIGVILGYVEKIKKYDPNFETPQIPTKGGGCYVATAVYGAYDCPQVWTLRRYRDNTLAKTWYGRAFIRTYYAISPTLVKWFGKTNWFKKLWKGKLDRMVRDLQAEGVESTPYEDRNW